MKYRTCTNCKERNPGWNVSCYNCNAPLTYKEEQRRREMRIENEARMANGKEPIHDVPETDESVEPAEREPGLLFKFCKFIKDL